MIYGAGVDIESISRFADITGKTSLMDKCFTPAEQEYILARKQFAQTAAGLFCAKEALFKAMRVGLGRFALTLAEVVHGEKGDPRFCLHGQLDEEMKDMDVHLSISHNASVAIAFVIIEK